MINQIAIRVGMTTKGKNLLTNRVNMITGGTIRAEFAKQLLRLLLKCNTYDVQRTYTVTTTKQSGELSWRISSMTL